MNELSILLRAVVAVWLLSSAVSSAATTGAAKAYSDMLSVVGVADLASGPTKAARVADAVRAIEDFLAEYPDNPLALKARNQQLRFLWEDGEFVRVMNLTEDLDGQTWTRGEKADVARLFLSRFVAAMSTGNVPEARRCLRILREKTPEDPLIPHAHFELIMYLSEKGMMEELADESAAFARATGYSPEAREYLERHMLAAEDLAVGNEPYEIKAKSLEGEDVSLHSLTGRVVVVYFFTIRGRRSREAASVLVSLYNRFADRGLQIIGINCDVGEVRDEVLRFMLAGGIKWPVLFDAQGEELLRARRWGVEMHMLPTAFVIGRDGRVAARKLGGSTLDLFVERLIMQGARK